MEEADRLHILRWSRDDEEYSCYLCRRGDPAVPLVAEVSAIFYEADDGEKWAICVKCAARIDPDVVDRWALEVGRDIQEKARRRSQASRAAECAHCAREAVAWDGRAMAAYKLRN
jgi:hypothetical protein